MECDLHVALAHRTLHKHLIWRNRGITIALDIARGLTCDLCSTQCAVSSIWVIDTWLCSRSARHHAGSAPGMQVPLCSALAVKHPGS